MRILYLTPYVPSRIRVRPFNLIKCLSAFHEISLVSLVCDEYERKLVHEVAEYCVSVDLVPLPKSRSYMNCLLSLPSSLPLRVAYYKSPELEQCVRRVIRERSIEVVHGELIKIAPLLQKVAKEEHVATLFDSVDCISWYLQQQRNTVRDPLRKAFVFSEMKRMRRFERRALASFDRTVITSAHDRDCLLALGAEARAIAVMPNGVDTEYFTPLVAPRQEDTLVFCAKLDYYPNSHAILHFCREVLPRIWQRRPDVRLQLVGNNPPEAVRNLASDERITVTGYVPDIRPYLGGASIALAPLHVAAGMQNKVLEALAMGTPMVATPGSCRSLQVKDGVHLLVAEEDQAFADAVVRLLEDGQLAQSLGWAGREFVVENYSWIEAAKNLSGLYREIVGAEEQQELVMP